MAGSGADVHISGSPEEWEWYAIDTKKGDRKDPFQALSKWSGANPDPLPLPPRSALARRVPLPGTLAASAAARPIYEAVPPTPIEEREAMADE